MNARRRGRRPPSQARTPPSHRQYGDLGRFLAVTTVMNRRNVIVLGASAAA